MPPDREEPRDGLFGGDLGVLGRGAGFVTRGGDFGVGAGRGLSTRGGVDGVGFGLDGFGSTVRGGFDGAGRVGCFVGTGSFGGS